MSNALTTSVTSALDSTDHPTIRRLNASRAAQQYSHPSRVRCGVMSVAHRHMGMELAIHQIISSDGSAQTV